MLLRTVYATIWAGLAAQATAQCANIQPASSPVAASGVSYKVLLNGLGAPRGITIDTAGNLLIAEQAGRGIRRVVLTKGEGLDVCVQSSSQLIPNPALNHGVAVSADGKTLFASSSTNVYAYTYDAAAGTVGQAKDIINGMQQIGAHQTRTLLIPKNNPNLLIVSRGSNANIDAETVNVGSGRSQIRVFDIQQLLGASAAVPYSSSGQVLGWGLRNSVGVGEDPTTGNIWSVENSIDDMQRTGRDIHNSNPGEELNFHGLPNSTDSAEFGQNFGYPPCVAIWDAANVQNYAGGAAVGKQMTGGHTAGGRTDDYCQAETQAPRLTFPAHMAPLDVKFKPDGSAALVAFHGSWNRQPPDGFRLSRIDFADGAPTAPASSTTAEKQLLWNANNAQCPMRCFRPTALALDDRGRLFMTSDQSGELFVVTGV